MKQVLLIDDDPAIQVLVDRMLGKEAFQVTGVGTGADAMRRVAGGFDGVVLLDLGLPDCSGADLLPKLLTAAPTAPVIVLTGRGTTDLALDSLQRGAFDFIDKSQLARRLVPAVHAASERAAPARGGDRRGDPFQEIVTRSQAMREVFRVLKNALPSKIPILVLGESGTGKELIAQAIHHGGPRSGGPLVAVNCAGIPENLLEAELFGFEKGAFTGASQRKPGRFDQARGGTLFLDEIGELPMSVQAKLLRVLQEGEYQRLGGVETLKADVRIVSATHRDLVAEVQKSCFREDLYYRLAVFTIELPPLRERHGDVALLVDFFLRRATAREGKRVRAVDPMALDLLSGFSFPGNVRQLENLLSFAVVNCQGPVLSMADLPRSFLRAAAHERRSDPQTVQAPPPRRRSPRWPRAPRRRRPIPSPLCARSSASTSSAPSSAPAATRRAPRGCWA